MSVITICGTLYTYSVYHHKKNKDAIKSDDNVHLSTY
uniref:Uncharacterized protein n=1 Tax=viral metagenome TaxID=1070528 RepID=A0A6C0C9I3_9ZZZZ